MKTIQFDDYQFHEMLHNGLRTFITFGGKSFLPKYDIGERVYIENKSMFIEIVDVDANIVQGLKFFIHKFEFIH